jgi:2-amino-4-hydroxy-6-hydroxymethyldihydropteridine diphosphokinase/dihydroneopterin aldolase/2-amino-4-hydroxy-6-hydroxymethyldihydropteridine diphosphokinase
VPAILSLGSNLGDRARTLADAVDEIAGLDGVRLEAVSDLFETVALKPEGPDATAPAYLNIVVIVATTINPESLLEELTRIEQAHGRTREVRWGDRTLDIDIVSMGGLQQESERLTLPHPQAAKRSFVLVPWLALDPDAELPGIGRIDRLPAAREDVPRYRAEADS